MAEKRETPLSRPPKSWALEKAAEYEAWAERPDFDQVARDKCMEEAAKMRRWADDLI